MKPLRAFAILKGALCSVEEKYATEVYIKLTSAVQLYHVCFKKGKKIGTAAFILLEDRSIVPTEAICAVKGTSYAERYVCISF